LREAGEVVEQELLSIREDLSEAILNPESYHLPHKPSTFNPESETMNPEPRGHGP